MVKSIGDLTTSQRKAIEEIRERMSNGGFGTYSDLERLTNSAGYAIKINGKSHAQVYFEDSKIMGGSGLPVVFPRSKGKKMPVHVYKRVLKDLYNDLRNRYGF